MVKKKKKNRNGYFYKARSVIYVLMCVKLSALYTKVDYSCYNLDVEFCCGGMYEDSEMFDFWLKILFSISQTNDSVIKKKSNNNK